MCACHPAHVPKPKGGAGKKVQHKFGYYKIIANFAVTYTYHGELTMVLSKSFISGAPPARAARHFISQRDGGKKSTAAQHSIIAVPMHYRYNSLNHVTASSQTPQASTHERGRKPLAARHPPEPSAT